MPDPLNHISQVLTGKTSFEECTVEELQAIISKYPYFSTAHYLLSKKMNDDRDVNNNSTTIYFNNPLLVNFLLSTNEKVKPVKKENKVEQSSSLNAQQEEEFFNDEIVYSNRNRVQEVMSSAVTMNAPIEKVGVNEIASETTPVFEPYHTVDYFASQGIRPNLEEQPKDRFGQQLKSFTDWLRTMKRLPETELTTTVSATSEEKVVTLAEHSIESREVVTESMAEVWVKQGQNDKAIEIYTKLSLLNPSKSAYFASLIENLKKH